MPAAAQRMATVKSVPFAVAKSQLETILSIVRERGPVLQARPIRSPAVGVLYTDPVSGGRARQLFETIMRQRLARMGINATYVLASQEEEGAVARSLQYLLHAKPTLILIASTTAPAGPDDVVGRAMLCAGCQIESFLAPVEPGNLLLLGYKDDVRRFGAGLFPLRQTECARLHAPTIVGAVSCFQLGDRQPRPWRAASLTNSCTTAGCIHRADRQVAKQTGAKKWMSLTPATPAGHDRREVLANSLSTRTDSNINAGPIAFSREMYDPSAEF
jgi:hypothetical protein